MCQQCSLHTQINPVSEFPIQPPASKRDSGLCQKSSERKKEIRRDKKVEYGLTLLISDSGTPLSRAYKCRCSLPVRRSSMASNWGQKPMFWCTSKMLVRMLEHHKKSTKLMTKSKCVEIKIDVKCEICYITSNTKQNSKNNNGFLIKNPTGCCCGVSVQLLGSNEWLVCCYAVARVF